MVCVDNAIPNFMEASLYTSSNKHGWMTCTVGDSTNSYTYNNNDIHLYSLGKSIKRFHIYHLNHPSADTYVAIFVSKHIFWFNLATTQTALAKYIHAFA